MNTFKKNSLYLAVAGASALAAGSAQAVALNADGLGNVLLYPYYTVREPSAGNAYNSLLSVVNSTSSAKAVKVRFLEGKNSREVLDFNLYLGRGRHPDRRRRGHRHAGLQLHGRRCLDGRCQPDALRQLRVHRCV